MVVRYNRKDKHEQRRFSTPNSYNYNICEEKTILMTISLGLWTPRAIIYLHFLEMATRTTYRVIEVYAVMTWRGVIGALPVAQCCVRVRLDGSGGTAHQMPSIAVSLHIN